MPAIASLEDLKAAQREGVSIYAMRYALCFTEMAQDRLEECVWSPSMGKVRDIQKPNGGRHPPTDVGTGRPRVDGLLCRGKLWLQERTPEQLKGEGMEISIFKK